MSNRSNLAPVKIVDQGDCSLTSITSPVTGIPNEDNIFYHAIFTGAPVGTLDVQVSGDYRPPMVPGGIPAVAGTWMSLGSSYQAAVSGAGSVMFDLNQLGGHYVRVQYVKTSGTGNMDLHVMGKRL